MNRKFNILFLFTFMLLLITAACRNENAVEYNNILVSYKDKADSDFVSMNKYINAALQEQKFDTIAIITDSAIDSLTKRINALNGLTVPPSGEEFRNATADYIRSLVDTSRGYKSYAILSDSTITVALIDSLREAMKKTEARIDTALKSMIVSQQDFARIKNLKLKIN